MPAVIARLNRFDRPVISWAYSRAIGALVFDPARFDSTQFDLTRFDPNDMDTAQFTHVSLCAGYGGIDLGLRRVLPDLRTIAYSEIEEYACGLLAARMENGHLDPAPIWSDLKTFPFSDFYGCVDILSGGYPCQPFSAAGKRRGTDDPRHLWPYIADGIRLCRPRICFFENVEGHISLGLRDVLGDLESLGYAATWGIFSAVEVGAPHPRKRVFILAHSLGAGLEGYAGHVHDQGWQSEGQAGSACTGSVRGWPVGPERPQHNWEPPRVTQPRLGRGPDGPAGRVDRLRLLGNGVVPATAERAFRTLYTRLFP